MMIDTKLEQVTAYFSWFEERPLGTVSVEEAINEIKFGNAIALKPDYIWVKQPRKAFRTRILERDDYTCYFCGDYGNTLEHLQPRSKGGRNTYDNCVCACGTCNHQKNDMTESEYWKYLADTYIMKQKEEKLLKEIFSSPK